MTTLYDKIWQAHVVCELSNDTDLLYIDRQLLHEVTSPQAFSGLRSAKLKPWSISANLATVDHNVPTIDQQLGVDAIANEVSKLQIKELDANCQDFGITEYKLNDINQGIVHVIGPEQGATLPGMTIVCGDSHTSTHGAFGTIAFGIGTSEVEHVLATQCLMQKKDKNMQVVFTGSLPKGASAKDMVLKMIATIGTAGGTGFAIEYVGEAIRDLSMEGRMTICNMTIEAGSRCGLIAPDATTFAYVENRPLAPKNTQWQQALQYWQSLTSDANAKFDKVVTIDISELKPQVSWGTSPEMVIAVDASVPSLEDAVSPTQKQAWQQALQYMGLKPKQKLTDIKLDRVFIGSCTNSRIEDLRQAADMVQQIGKKVASNIKQAMVVPGSGLVKQQAEKEGLDKIFIQAGFQWRQPGCSMCLAMNDDKLQPQERCAATSNRNFEGRQGKGGRTHLVSPAMAAAAALYGSFVDTSIL